MKTVYVVTMYRFGSRERHSYIFGVFSSLERAKLKSNKEVNDRGGKYQYEIIETVINGKFEEMNTVKSL